MQSKTAWIWCDLEMTGLDTKKHRIIEIATIITDDQLNVIAEGPNVVIHQASQYLEDLDPWINKHHGESGLLAAVRESSISQMQAEKETLEFISAHTIPGKSPLCGNSIGTDRAFISAHMPALAQHFHYRNIDVSSVKQLYEAWYPKRERFMKKNHHRALDDIKESIAELAFYQKAIFVTTDAK
jgi:oligoribonuclease